MTKQTVIGSIPLEAAGRYSYGDGSIIQVKNGGYYGDVIANLYWEIMPVFVQGDVEVLLNRLDRSWVVTLINNNGVTKSPAVAEVSDGAHAPVTVSLVAGTPSAVNTWRSIHSVESAGNQTTVDVDSGDVVVIELKDPE